MIFRNATAQTLRNVDLAPIVGPLFYESSLIEQTFGFILVTGVWKKITEAYTVSSGTWKKINQVDICFDSNWKNIT